LRAYLVGEEVDKLRNGHLDAFSNHKYFINRNSIRAQSRPRPLLLGQPQFLVAGRLRTVFASGGAGYTLNRAALDLFAKEGKDFFKDTTDPKEDVYMSKFFEGKGVSTADTRDPEGGWRFLGSCLDDMTNFNGIRNEIRPRMIRSMYDVNTLVGTDAFSAQTISFHLKRCQGSVKDLMHEYHSFSNMDPSTNELSSNPIVEETLGEMNYADPDPSLHRNSVVKAENLMINKIRNGVQVSRKILREKKTSW